MAWWQIGCPCRQIVAQLSQFCLQLGQRRSALFQCARQFVDEVAGLLDFHVRVERPGSFDIRLGGIDAQIV